MKTLMFLSVYTTSFFMESEPRVRFVSLLNICKSQRTDPWMTERSVLERVGTFTYVPASGTSTRKLCSRAAPVAQVHGAVFFTIANRKQEFGAFAIVLFCHLLQKH